MALGVIKENTQINSCSNPEIILCTRKLTKLEKCFNSIILTLILIHSPISQKSICEFPLVFLLRTVKLILTQPIPQSCDPSQSWPNSWVKTGHFPAVCCVTSMKVLFQRREWRVMTALLSRPRRGHLIVTHFAPSLQDCQQRREHKVTTGFPYDWLQMHRKYNNMKQKNRTW